MIDFFAKLFGSRTKRASSFQAAVGNLGLPTSARTKDPLRYHPWAYAACRAIASNFAQVPFRVMRETPDRTNKIARGRFSARACSKRIHDSRRMLGLQAKGMEPDPDHPISLLMERPNPWQTGDDLWSLTVLWLLLKGEAFWFLATDDLAKRLVPGEIPSALWPINPALVTPNVQNGRFVSWRVSNVSGVVSPFPAGNVDLAHHEVAHFRFQDSEDLLRGFSPMTPLAARIAFDLGIEEHNRSVLENGATPGGILTSESTFGSDEEQRKFLESFKQQHTGANRKGRIAMLTGGWKWIQTAMSPKDMDYLDAANANREAILAALGVPKSVLSVTDDLNYATALAQDRAFVERTLFPLFRLCEAVVNATVFYPESDDVVGLFDTSGIEALRIGLSDKIDQARKLAGPELHVPPALAFSLVGLDVQDYEGAGVAVASAINAPLDFSPEPVVPSSEKDAVVVGGSRRQELPLDERTTRKASREDLWASFDRGFFAKVEPKWLRAWSRFSRDAKAIALAPIDAAGGTRGFKREGEEFDVDALLPDLADLQRVLLAATNETANETLGLAFNFTVESDLAGEIPVIAIDDPKLDAFMKAYRKRLSGTIPKTIQKELREAISESIAAGESLAKIRTRVVEVMRRNASEAKSLVVARTESGAVLNGTRKTMFDAQGFDKRSWITAGDEHVRDSHVAFGSSGTHPVGFNYLSLVGSASGILEYPHDPKAPASEVVNCRCVLGIA